MPVEKVDYEEVRRAFSIEDVAAILGIQGKRRGEQIRATCPATESGELVITPSKNAFYCFSRQCKLGGSTLELYAHAKGIYVHDAALELSKLITPQEMQPLSYLLPKHQAVQAFFPEDIAARMGIGYAPRGTMIGRVCFPMRNDSGKLVGYIGYGEYLKPRFKIGRFHL